MGHTHHWYRAESLDVDRFSRWATDVDLLLKHLPSTTNSYPGMQPRICGYDGTGVPLITDNLVAFNGDANQYSPHGIEMSHQGFWLSREYSHPSIDGQRWANKRGWPYAFCKTARKPYDLLVVAGLVRLAYHFPEATEISSDGSDPDDWKYGLALVEHVFGFAALPFKPYYLEDAAT
jgi:hypothetical protein